MRIYLEYMGYSVELPEGETSVGRDISCGLRFNDSSISRRHALFLRDGDQVFVEDLGSTNGTILNGTKIVGTAAISDRDTIEIGGYVLQVNVIDDVADLSITELSKKPRRKLATLADLSLIKKPISQSKTVQIPAAVPRAVGNQPCPQCEMLIPISVSECPGCGFSWGTTRMSRPTVKPSDRRRHDRRPIDLDLIYTSSELEIEATTRDLSQSGVFVCTQVLDRVGTRCELTILMDGGPPLHIAGIVRRVVEQAGREPVGLGIEFDAVGEAERTWLELAVTHQSVTSNFDRVDRD